MVAVVSIGRTDVATVEVQDVAVGGVVRGRRPVVAVATDIVLRPTSATDVSGKGVGGPLQEAAL